MTMFKRVIVVVLDSVGIGALPDADAYGDEGANTICNIARSQGGLHLPTLERLGIGCIAPIEGVRSVERPLAFWGKMSEISKGKDTTTGHWEMAGCPVFKPFPVYPDGFPSDMVEAFQSLIGRKILGNKAASGTEIIAELGEEHMKTGFPIVYTSADSVFQIAAHEDIIPLEELYSMCKIARDKVCINEHAVGRIIARPFVGSPGNFKRTVNRHDYSLLPNMPTILDLMKDAGYGVVGIGKIGDIFAHKGLTESFVTKSNDHGMQQLLKLTNGWDNPGLIMANLVEFDSIYGHRNDARGYGRALERVDAQLALLIDSLKDTDLLIITADHGCDPTVAGTDHTREFVPLLAYHLQSRGGSLGIRTSFADVAATVAENFSLNALKYGESFLNKVI